MLFYLGKMLQEFWGPARLLSSYAVLITVALYLGFFLALKLIPKFYNRLPHDRGRDFALKENSDAAKGKPTGAGSVFITLFVLIVFFVCPMNLMRSGVVLVTWATMLTGFLDDRSTGSWAEYLKGALELVISVTTAFS